MKYLKALFFFVIISIIQPINAKSYIVNTPVLNIRSCAGTNCKIIGKLTQNASLNSIKEHGEWVEIETENGSGYVIKKALAYDGASGYNYRFTFSFIIFTIICIFYCIKYSIFKRNRKLICSVTKLNRGTKSERELILTLLKLGIQPDSIFHDLYIEKHDGKFSQIDLVLVTQVGIIVFEVKDYSGWIYGEGNKSSWTKVLAYGKEKYKFYNPVMQNNGHIKQLRQKLKEDIPFYSIVIFYGNNKLKNISFIPNGTFVTKWYRIKDVLNIIMQENPTANYKDKEKIIKILKKAVANGDNIEIPAQHIENINDMLGKNRVFH